MPHYQSMATTDRPPIATPVVAALWIWVLMVALSWFVAIEERSPIHSDSGLPLVAIWVVGAVVGVVLLILRKWDWAGAWLISTIATVVGFAGSVFLFVLTHGS
jgi:hypothetical protein